MTLYSPLSIKRHRRGLTLVELLVAVSIMVMLVAISVPSFKPMLESQRAAGGARALSQALQRARVKAVQEGRPAGVSLMRYENAPNLSLQIRHIREANRLVEIDANLKVTVDANGNIELHEYNSNTGTWQSKDFDDTNWNDKVKADFLIQFGRTGRFYELSSSTKINGSIIEITDPTDFTITMPPRATLAAPIVMPRETVVDLEFSGVNDQTNFSDASATSGGVAILFSPMGHVSECMVGGKPATQRNGMYYFLVGEWDRQADGNAKTLAEDGRNNLQTYSNFWVSVHARTGEVRISENNASDNVTVQDARKFARERYVDIGGH